MRQVSISHNHEKSLEFIRIAVASGITREESTAAAEVAKLRFGEKALATRLFSKGGMDELAVRKASVAAGSTLDDNWAELLADTESAAAAFFAFVRERMLIGRIAGFRTVPLNIPLIKMTTGLIGEWIGEGMVVPVGKAAFARDTLPARKVASMTVVTKELLKSSDPSAEPILRDDLARAVGAAIDATFLDPDNSGVDDIRPASVTHDADTVTATGDALVDLRALIAGFEGDLERAVLIGHPERFAEIYDPQAFPNIGVRGGSALGIPAFPSKAAGENLVLLDPALVAVGTGTVSVRTASQGTVELETEPTQSATEGVKAELVSLWQNNLTAMMAMADANWSVAIPHVRVLEPAE